MNQEKIGIFIKELRKQNNLTQQQLAEMLGVTYQAVSKWETGKNIPDISIMQKISDCFNVDINEILSGEKKDSNINQNKINKKLFIIIIISILGLVTLTIFLIIKFLDNANYEFKTLSTTCDEFIITGSVAYNKEKSSIYIANINYCGGSDNTEYKKISCILYESHDNAEIKISDCSNKKNTNLTLTEYLEDVQMVVDDYETSCKDFQNTNLYLQINATDKQNKTTSYTVPLSLNQACNP